MLRQLLALSAVLLMLTPAHAAPTIHRLETGKWRAWVEITPNPDPSAESFPFEAAQHRVPFELELARWEGGVKAWLVNAGERIEVPRTTWAEGQLTISIDYYDSTIEAAVSEDGKTMVGQWKKRRGSDKWGVMPFGATVGEQPRFPHFNPPGAHHDSLPLAKRWRINFADDPDPAIGIFDFDQNGIVTGTILTTTGDYRFLAGVYQSGVLLLSAFDGSHAFLIGAVQHQPGKLKGDFYSGNWAHSTWTAEADDTAALPEGWSTDTIRKDKSLKDVSVRTLDGLSLTLDDPRVRGERGTLFALFGTWCPNCLDETRLLAELHEKYSARGVKIVGLAFELTGDETRDRDKVRLYAERFKVPYLLLLAGVSEKSKAAAAMPILERIKAYPTTLFVDRTGTIKSIHTGFSGPATGDEYTKLRAAFEKHIEQLIAE
ncbi:MAG TPA: TlpA disulfide reductase family protein [Phycisphaerales bacterium]|nr:TlpA disulfide reductase family protein [Phycisphaerales bacterium]